MAGQDPLSIFFILCFFSHFLLVSVFRFVCCSFSVRICAKIYTKKACYSCIMYQSVLIIIIIRRKSSSSCSRTGWRYRNSASTKCVRTLGRRKNRARSDRGTRSSRWRTFIRISLLVCGSPWHRRSTILRCDARLRDRCVLLFKYMPSKRC